MDAKFQMALEIAKDVCFRMLTTGGDLAQAHCAIQMQQEYLDAGTPSDYAIDRVNCVAAGSMLSGTGHTKTPKIPKTSLAYF